MKFSGKQLFEVWNDEAGKAWHRHYTWEDFQPQDREPWDALAEKINAMMEPERCPICGDTRPCSDERMEYPSHAQRAKLNDWMTVAPSMRDSGKIIFQGWDGSLHEFDGRTITKIVGDANDWDGWTKEPLAPLIAEGRHPNTHTRSCREKMEKGKECSC